LEPRIDVTPPRVYCDFNDCIGPTTFGLSVLGTVADLQRQHIELAEGLRLVLYDYDGFDDGEPAWIAAEAVVITHPTRGFVAEVDRFSFRWVRRRSDPDSDLRSLARFRVEVAFDVTGRGGVLAGSIMEGALRIGQTAAVRGTEGSTVYLEISAVEFLDYIAAGESKVALLFSGAPLADLLRMLAPVGTILDFA
jgi:translation elongation factor EF-Tu-like GTPase